MSVNKTLLRLMSLGQFQAVCRTSDGYYMAQVPGDLGYNAFLGRPAPVHDGLGHRQMLQVWAALSTDEQVAVWRLAQNPLDGSPIPLDSDFGVPRPEGKE